MNVLCRRRVFFAVIRQRLYGAAVRPLLYVCAVLLEVFCAVQFFFVQQFFGGSGTSDLHYFFSAVPYVCTILVPALCLREKTASVPLPLGILAETVAEWTCVFLQFCALLVPLLFLPMCVNLFGDVDAGQAAAGFSMLALYGAASCALCVFCNALFSSRPAAFVVSAAALAVTNAAHLLAESAVSSPVLSAIIRSVSFARHFDSAGRGILDSRDAAFYAVVCAALVALSAFVRERRAGRRFAGRRVSLVSFAALLLFALLDSTRFYFRADMTGGRRLSLSSCSRRIASRADAPVKLTYYRSGILASLYPGVRDIPDILAEYSYFGPVSVGTVDADKNAASLLSDYGIYGRQIQTVGSNRTEFVTVYSAVVVEYKGSWDAIPFVLSSDGLEYAVTARLQHLLSGRRPSVQVLVGNGMTISDDYGYVLPWLEAQGFSCTEIRTDAPLAGQLERGRALCVFGSSEITAEQAADIELFLSEGGRAFFAVSPYSSDIAGSWSITENEETGLTDMLNSYGFGFSRNLAGDISCARITMESGMAEDGSAAELHTRQLNYPLWISVLPQRNAVQGMTVFWPVALQPEADSVVPLLLSSSAAYQVAPDFDSGQSLFVTNPFLLDEQGYARDAVEQGAVVLGAALDGTVRGMYVPDEFDVSAVLVSDPYFANSLMLGYIGGRYGDYRNLDFLENALLKLCGAEELAALQEKSFAAASTRLYKTPDYRSFAAARRSALLCEFAAVPALVAVAAACMLLFRKQRVASLSEEIRGKKK